MRFNEFLGPETIDKEYKLGVLYFLSEMSFDECLEYIETGQWDFNGDIMNTITVYLKKYLAKYISSFTHNLSGLEKAELYIGINDDGIVKGIPFKGKLNLGFCYTTINNIIRDDLQFPSDGVMRFLKKNLKIQAIKLDYEHTHTNSEYFRSSVLNYYTKNDKIRKYEEYRKMWCTLINKGGGKINENLNNNRIEFINYLDECRLDPIRKSSTDDGIIVNKSRYNHTYSHLEYLIDIPNYYDMRASLRCRKFNELKRGNVIKYKEIISSKRSDLYLHEYNDVFCLYLYGRFHDYKRDLYRSFRPTQPKMRIDVNYPRFLLSQIEHMIPVWKNNNNNINLYVIKITIPSSFIEDGDSIKFNNIKKRRFEELFRTMSPNGPITLCLQNP